MEIIKSKRKTHLFLHEKAENVMESSKIFPQRPKKFPPPLRWEILGKYMPLVFLSLSLVELAVKLVMQV